VVFQTEGAGFEPARACARRFSSSFRFLASGCVWLYLVAGHGVFGAGHGQAVACGCVSYRGALAKRWQDWITLRAISGWLLGLTASPKDSFACAQFGLWVRSVPTADRRLRSLAPARLDGQKDSKGPTNRATRTDRAAHRPSGRCPGNGPVAQAPRLRAGPHRRSLARSSCPAPETGE